jgi:hypothetical protein
MEKLTANDWVEIYYAVQDKQSGAAVSGDKIWKKHLAKILKIIGEDGRNMFEPTPVKVVATVEGGVVQGAYSSDPGVTFEVWDWDDKEQECSQAQAERKFNKLTKGLGIIY